MASTYQEVASDYLSLMDHRLFLAAIVLILGQSRSTAQYRIVMERGDTLQVKEYYTKGDSLGFPGGRVAKKDVLCMTSGKHIYQFPLPGMNMSRTKLEETDPLCRRAALFGIKYVKAEPGTQVADPLLDSLSTNEWMRCFTAHCPARAVDVEKSADVEIEVVEEASPLDGVRSDVDITSPGTLIVLRNGDTLSAPRGVTWTKDQIHFIGGGDMPRADVLMLVDLGGQHVFNEHTGQKVKLKPQVRDLSPCALGVIYARMYWDSFSTATQIPGIPKTLTDDPDFSECFYYQQVRAQKKKDTISTIKTVIAVGTGGVRGIQGAGVPVAP